MTVTSTPTTDIEPVLAGALQLLRDKPEITLEDLAAEVAAAIPAKVSPEAQPFPALPRKVAIPGTFTAALQILLDMLNSVELDSRRSLAQTEVDLLTREKNVITAVGTVLAAREKAISEIIRVHMDVAAEEAGVAIPRDQAAPDGTVIVAATPRDQNGHYLLAGPQAPHQVQSGPVAWSQEYGASAPAPSDGELQAAFEGGEITAEDYNSVTRLVRVFDPIKARAYIRKSPARGLSVLRRITRGGTPRASLYLRKVS